MKMISSFNQAFDAVVLIEYAFPLYEFTSNIVLVERQALN